MLDLDEADAAFDKPPGREQLHAEVATVRLVEAVERLGFGGLLAKSPLLREPIAACGRPVHTRRCGPPARDRAGYSTPRSALRRPIRSLPTACDSAENGRCGAAEVERVVRIDAQRHGVVGRPQVVAVSLVPVLASADRNELRQVVVQRAETVMHPGAERRKVAVVQVAPGVELRLCSVIAVGRPHRTDDRQLVDVLRDMRKPVADLDAALPVLVKADLQRIERVPLIAVGVGNHQSLERQFLRILRVGERRFGDRLAAVLGEHRLRVEALHVADAAVHEQPDHALRFGSEMRLAVGRRPVSITAVAIALQHGREHRPVKPMPRSARNVRRGEEEGE